ncbi:MAG: hypothetical protein COV99_05235 [Bacteroidetes bacterium CG12_big_fil_rev_8_21_14_0_65_60_17]|nr:MAG: hypothetical protein COV99_05235 [Bacteroidetes bacterium CG12_big_fil_rev_8_21_14_0_65_60_17]
MGGRHMAAAHKQELKRLFEQGQSHTEFLAAATHRKEMWDRNTATPTVLQLVTFRFLPGHTEAALAIYRNDALPLYRQNQDMVQFRAYREVESPVPLDLMVVSRFRGMQGMDASNESLRELAALAGTSMGALYGAISDHAAGHTDEFVTLLPGLGTGAHASRLTAFIRYRIVPGKQERFETLLREHVAPWEARNGVSSETGRFLVSDGWDYLRMISFSDLHGYETWWRAMHALDVQDELEAITSRRQEIILGTLTDFSVR